MSLGAIAFGLDILKGIMGAKAERDQTKAQQKQMAEQATNAIKSMNYALSNFEQERRDAFDTAVKQLEKNQLASYSLISSVQSAVSENMGDSKTGRLLIRSTNADVHRTTTSIKDNYSRRSNEVDLNKELQVLQTQNFIKGLHPPKLPSTLENIITVGASTLSGYTKYQNWKAGRTAQLGYGTRNANPLQWTGVCHNADAFMGRLNTEPLNIPTSFTGYAGNTFKSPF